MEVTHRLPMPQLEIKFRDEHILGLRFDDKRIPGSRLFLRLYGRARHRWLARRAGLRKWRAPCGRHKRDGYIGENVTANIKTILTVPLTLLEPIDGGSVPGLVGSVGEGLYGVNRLSELNQDRIERRTSLPLNPSWQAAISSLMQIN